MGGVRPHSRVPGIFVPLPGIEPEPLYRCASCENDLPASAFYPAYANNHGSGSRGGSGYCRACHSLEPIYRGRR